jgi:hypothetical protein
VLEQHREREFCHRDVQEGDDVNARHRPEQKRW